MSCRKNMSGSKIFLKSPSRPYHKFFLRHPVYVHICISLQLAPSLNGKQDAIGLTLIVSTNLQLTNHNQPIYLSNSLCICLSIYLCLYLYIFYVSVYISIYASVYISVYVSIYASVYISYYPSI